MRGSFAQILRESGAFETAWRRELDLNRHDPFSSRLLRDVRILFICR
jgi:hypothetical protein